MQLIIRRYPGSRDPITIRHNPLRAKYRLARVTVASLPQAVEQVRVVLRTIVLMLHYNDLSQDLDAGMRRIAAFLRIEVNEVVWPSLVKAAGFSMMQAEGDTLMPQLRTVFAKGSASSIRAATAGGGAC